MENKKVKVMILGVYHFGSKGEHLVDEEVADVMTDEKQQEIRDVISKLSRFNPTKIAVEARQSKVDELNEVYLNYCENKVLEENKIIDSRNEIFQLGFRLAEKLNHNRIYSVDVPQDLPMEQVIEYAEKNCSELYKNFMELIENDEKVWNNMQENSTVCEILRNLNDPKNINNEHSDIYLRLNKVGAGDDYCGANMMTEWYRRNLKIFSNLQDIAESEDRILVIYGAGHCKILQELVGSYNGMELVDAEEYL